MARKKVGPIETAYRLTVMLGTLGVGGMAAYRYGPPPEQLAEVIDGMAGMAAEVVEPSEQIGATASATDVWAPTEDTATEPPRFDPQVRQASLAAPAMGDASTESLARTLRELGATQYEVKEWGRGTERVFRATAARPVGANTELVRRFDAIGSTPEDAVAKLAAQLRAVAVR